MINGTEEEGERVLLLIVYAPNENNPPFMKTIFDLIVEKAQSILLIGGDINCVINASSDKSPSSNMCSSARDRRLKNLCETFTP